MGGGALKVDSVQMNRFFFPSLDRKLLDALDELGTRALKTKLGLSSVIDEIDKVVLSGLCGNKVEETIDSLRVLLTDYVNRRNGVR
jgi:hypothetical protein